MVKLPSLLTRRRGASGMTYGVMLGLIGVVALLAVTRLGLTTSNLFCATSSGLSGEPGCAVQSVPDAPPLPTPSLSISGGGSAMTVTGPGNPAYSAPVLLTISNGGTTASGVPTPQITPANQFEITATSCTAPLNPGQSCTATIRARAVDNGTLSGSFSVAADNAPSITLSGTASGFSATLALTGGNTGLNVTGPGNPAYGTPVNFTLTNTSAITSAAPTAAVSPTTNFTITANGCGGALAAGASCAITVRPQATADGSLSATLSVTANNNPTLALSGTASGFTTAQTSCQTWRNLGYTSDGSYSIDPDGTGTLTAPANAYCDMDGADGWTLIAYNNAPTTFTNFNRPWADYKTGFGSPTSGSLGLGWIGNDRINALTVGGKTMRVLVGHSGGTSTHLYNGFTVANEAAKYQMSFSTSTAASPATNDGGYFALHSGNVFSTYDRDNDSWGNNCASSFATGWWHNACYYMTIAGNNNSRVYWQHPTIGTLYVTSSISMWVK